MRCVKDEENVGEVHKVYYIPMIISIITIRELMEDSSRCNGSFWEVW